MSEDELPFEDSDLDQGDEYDDFDPYDYDDPYDPFEAYGLPDDLDWLEDD